MGRFRLRIVLFLLPLVGLGYLLYSSRTVEVRIDGTSEQFRTIFFSDCDDGGDSKIVSLPDSNSCILSYKIGETTPFPFVGCGFCAKDTSHVLDLSKYKTMTLLLDSSLCDTFTLALNFFKPNVSSLSDAASQVPLVRDVVSNSDSLVFHLSELTNRTLWERLTLFAHSEGDFPLEKLAAITFESHERFLRGDLHRIGVTGIVFTGDKEKAIRNAMPILFYTLLPLLLFLAIQYRRVLLKMAKGAMELLRVLFRVSHTLFRQVKALSKV